MFTPQASFSGFSVSDTAKAEAFYKETLGLQVTNTGMGLQIMLPGGGRAFAYEKADHQPATFTILNFIVANIDTAVDEMVSSGVALERYEGLHQDEKGVARGIAAGMGPDIAWFTDPSGNILSVLQEPPTA